MKKLLMFTTVVIVSLSLVGCGSNKDKGDMNTNTTNTEKEVVEDNNETIVNEENTDSTAGNETQMDIANEAADKVAEMDEVDSATIIVTNQNAYAAVMLNSEITDLTDALEEEIADKVRETDANIQKVYVSTNPDFIERMTSYGEEISAGNPVEGFIEEFTESVQRVFPDAH